MKLTSLWRLPSYLMEDDTTILEPTVNYQADGDIFISLEDQFIVTEDGAECLTKDAPLDLYL
jgi:Xaa-Pro aminopeptidase